MKNSIVLLSGLLLLSACTSPSTEAPEIDRDSDVGNASVITSTEQYKEAFFKGEIPVTWSYVSNGDIGPMPYSENSWIEPQYIKYSFAQYDVAYGDTNWTQVDIAFMEGSDLKRWVEYLKSDSDFEQFVQEWKQETIDGRTVDVVVLSTEPDGTVSKGGTGGEIYFVPAKSDEEIEGEWFAHYGLIIQKQALGEAEFEEGFDHFMETVDFDAA